MKSAVTIGTFDGIHLGHQALLNRTSKYAADRSLESVAYTFGKPPQNYLGRPKSLLMPSQTKLAHLKSYVDVVEVADFVSIQPLSPEDFVESILVKKLGAEVVVIGDNFCFGKNRAGNVETLKVLGSQLGFEVDVVDPVTISQKTVSSTAIREALKQGHVEEANMLLGKRHRIWGEVIKGAGHGRTIGYPTANLRVDSEILVPAEGIYAVRVITPGGDEKLGALYIGKRPTMENSDEISLEVHLLDVGDLDLYGAELELALCYYIRPDKKLDSEQELVAQIAQDLEEIRAYFQQEKS